MMEKAQIHLAIVSSNDYKSFSLAYLDITEEINFTQYTSDIVNLIPDKNKGGGETISQLLKISIII